MTRHELDHLKVGDVGEEVFHRQWQDALAQARKVGRGQFGRMLSPRTSKSIAPANRTKPKPKHSQLAVRIFSCLSSKEMRVRDTGGFSGTLSFRSMMEAAKNRIEPEKHMIAGNSTVTAHPHYTSRSHHPAVMQETLDCPL